MNIKYTKKELNDIMNGMGNAIPNEVTSNFTYRLNCTAVELFKKNDCNTDDAKKVRQALWDLHYKGMLNDE